MPPPPSPAPVINCSACGTQTQFGSATCSACGASLAELMGSAETLEMSEIERDPEVIEVWEHLRQAAIGEYDIYAPLGRGGMATVFLALDLALEREVAIKVISPNMLQTKSLVERFKREARTSASLSHPNIIPVHQVRESDGLVFFVMKYVDGRSLESIIREEGPLAFDVASHILAQVGSALDFAHKKGVVHRDVKPANVMIDQDGWAIVTDFGIAKVADSGGLTSAGIVVGTPSYMSPEQFAGGAVSGAADQYSLGIVAYQMLTGKTPFASCSSIADVMRAHMLDQPESPRVLRPDIPASVANVIIRMIAKDPLDRFPTIGDAIAALEPLSRAREEGARSAMITLARSGANKRPRISVPLSPVPTRAIAPRRVGNAEVRAAARKRRALAIVGGIAVILLVGIMATAIWDLRLASRAALSPNGALATAPALSVTTAVFGDPKVSTDTMLLKQSATAKYPVPTLSQGKRPTSPEQFRKTTVSAARNTDKIQPREKAASVADGNKNAPADPSTPRQNSALSQPAVAPSATAPPPVVARDGVVQIGSRIPGAVLYFDDRVRGLITSLRYFVLPAGQNKIGVRAEGCDPWEGTVTVVPGDTTRLGFKNPNCK